MIKWNKAKTNFVVDFTILLSFLGIAISGLVLWFILPSSGRGLEDASRVFILSRSAWKLVHNWLGVNMVAGVALHLILHWKWIVSVAGNMWRDAFASQPSPTPVAEKLEA